MNVQFPIPSLQLVSRTFSPIGDIVGNATVTILDDDSESSLSLFPTLSCAPALKEGLSYFLIVLSQHVWKMCEPIKTLVCDLSHDFKNES